LQNVTFANLERYGDGLQWFTRQQYLHSNAAEVTIYTKLAGAQTKKY